MQHDMVMRGQRRARMVEIAGHVGIDPERAAHAQMHHQHHAVVEIAQQIFRPPRQAHHPPPRQARGKILREGKPQIGPALLDADDAATLHGRGKAGADGFDFGEFGHGEVIALPAPARKPSNPYRASASG